ncbi:unnamed protein product, partial [Rangifer tarandus platyrhynchus]
VHSCSFPRFLFIEITKIRWLFWNVAYLFLCHTLYFTFFFFYDFLYFILFIFFIFY